MTVQGDSAVDSEGERRTVFAFFDAHRRMDLGGVLACFCDDGVMHTPYAPAPLPRIRSGQRRLRRTFQALFEGSVGIALADVEILSTERPHFWVAAWSFDIELSSGQTYSARDIGTFRLRGGLIEEYIEYFDPVAFAQSYGIELSERPRKD